MLRYLDLVFVLCVFSFFPVSVHIFRMNVLFLLQCLLVLVIAFWPLCLINELTHSANTTKRCGLFQFGIYSMAVSISKCSSPQFSFTLGNR
jgi:hypothetical protein